MTQRIFLSVLITVAVLFSFSCRSKTVVKKLVNQNQANMTKSETKKIDGVMYYLPKTMVQVTVPVNKVTEEVGEFSEFAPCFFSKSESYDRIKEKSTAFSVSPPSFSSRGVPDTSATYVISTKGKYFESKSLFVEYAPGNVLTKGEAESKNETLEFTAKAIATAAGIAAKIAPLAISTDPDANRERIAELGREHQCYETLKTDDAGNPRAGGIVGALNTSQGLVDTEINHVNGTAVLGAAAMANFYKASDKYRTQYQTAKALFDELTKLISQSNAALANNGQNVPTETYKIMREKNAESIAAHRAAFLGGKSRETWSATFEFAPDKINAESYSPLLFSYSTKKGVCNSGELKTKSISIAPAFRFAEKDKSCENTTESKIQTLWLKVMKANSQTYLDNIEAANLASERNDKSRGWYYRVPANANVTLERKELDCVNNTAGNKSCLINSFTLNDASVAGCAGNICYAFQNAAAPTAPTLIVSTQIAFNEMPVAQLGVVASVPASTAGRSSVTAIMLDPSTGAMKNYKSSSLPLVDKAILDDAQKAANSVIDAADPLNKQKRELEELKTQNQINEEKKKLANTNTGNQDN